MSIKQRSLGTVSAAARGIVITAGAAATPWVATVTAGHRLKVGDRLGVTGITTQVGSNGDWTVSATAATTATMEGSSATGAFAGTAVTAVLCDVTPFLARHSAAAIVNQPSGAVWVGTVVFEAADKRTDAQFSYDLLGVDTAGFKDALKSGEIAIPAATAGQVVTLEVNLSRYMTFRASAFTSGVAGAVLLA
jgi:hypothetical protein